MTVFQVAFALVVIVISAVSILVHFIRKGAKEGQPPILTRHITVDREAWEPIRRQLAELGASPEEAEGIIRAGAIMATDLATFRNLDPATAVRMVQVALVTPLYVAKLEAINEDVQQRQASKPPTILPAEPTPPRPAPDSEAIAAQARRVAAAVAERTAERVASRATRLGRSPLKPRHDAGRGRASWTAADVATLTGWSERTVYTWAQAGRIPCERSGRRVRFHAGEVRAWWQQYRRERTNQPPTSTETEGGQVDLPFAKEA